MAILREGHGKRRGKEVNWPIGQIGPLAQMNLRGFGSIASKHGRVAGRIIEKGECLEKLRFSQNLEILPSSLIHPATLSCFESNDPKPPSLQWPMTKNDSFLIVWPKATRLDGLQSTFGQKSHLCVALAKSAL